MDPELDFLSEHFDPLKALRTPGVTPPIAKAKPRDYVAQCTFLLDHSDAQFAAPRLITPPEQRFKISPNVALKDAEEAASKRSSSTGGNPRPAR